jgi:hypothetical protein
MTKRILLKKETLDKIQALKKLFNITKDTTYIDQLVNDRYDLFFAPTITSIDINK